MDPIKNAKSADHKTKDIIMGYIHEMQSKLKLPDITELIAYIILGFYHNPEFIASFLEKYFEISKDKLTITQKVSISFWQHAIYLNRWIDSTSKAIVKWTLKINDRSGNPGMYFGIVSEEKEPNLDFGGPKHKTSANYCVSFDGMRYINNIHEITIDGFVINEGDSVSFILDLINKTWKAQINDGKEYDLCHVEISIDIKYKFAMAMGCARNSVSLIGFELSY